MGPVPEQPAAPVEWPPPILDRIRRVLDYHAASKLTFEEHHARPKPEPSLKPASFRTFGADTKIALPTNLPAVGAPTVSLLAEGRKAVPDSQLDPPADLRTLATWLFLGDGLTGSEQRGTRRRWRRSLPSMDETYPCELYIAAFAIDGLEPGLYYYSPREFALFRLRAGLGVLSHIKRGRPELDYLKTCPAAVLVSTVYARATWAFGRRGYRTALLEAGTVVENLMQTGTALGLVTAARLRLNEAGMNELIGVPRDADFEHLENVQAMVTWNEPRRAPQTAPPGQLPMPPIDRATSKTAVERFDTILQTHEDCVAPGVAIREIRPPLTELSPLMPGTPAYFRDTVEPPSGGKPLGPMVMNRAGVKMFVRKAIPRDVLLSMTHLALRGPVYPPLAPGMPHAAIIRPVWFIHDVVGLDSGVWYYHPPTHQWSHLAHGNYRLETAYTAAENPLAGAASAICVFIAELHQLLHGAGPDAYRLAHLEAGVQAHRLQLLAEAHGLSALANARFYDDELRRLLGLELTGWEIIHQVLIGEAFDPTIPLSNAPSEPTSSDQEWRD